MTQLDEIYSTRLLELASELTETEKLAEPDASATAHSKLCGSTVIADVKMKDGIVTHYSQTVKACLLGQAAASVMARNIIGSTGAELRKAGSEMRAMLKENGPPPKGRWADLANLEPVRHFKARHASTLLVFDAVEDAVRQIETAQSQSDSAPVPQPVAE
ncbi:hypothetical protein MnTg02_01561 [bacterium MnTg02]|nr:hypothetical protein MnTg02_01561 [bacterium MnTg02]